MAYWRFYEEKAFPYECSKCGCGHFEPQATCDRCGTVIRPELLQKPGIHGVSKEKWLAAFADAVRIAIDKDYFSDILFFDLYPGTHEKAAEIDEEEEELINNVYDEKWNYVKDAFKEIFGEELW